MACKRSGVRAPLPPPKVLMFHLYILWSESRKRFYVGHSSDLEDRLVRHNEGRSKATKAGCPWLLVHNESYDTKSEAVRRELEIKGWKVCCTNLRAYCRAFRLTRKGQGFESFRHHRLVRGFISRIYTSPSKIFGHSNESSFPFWRFMYPEMG
jgi:putative endonuclease